MDFGLCGMDEQLTNIVFNDNLLARFNDAQLHHFFRKNSKKLALYIATSCTVIILIYLNNIISEENQNKNSSF